MNAPELSKQAVENIQNVLYGSPQWKSLYSQLQAAKATFDLPKIAMLSEQMKRIEQECIENYAKSLEEEKCDFISLARKMEKKECDKFLKRLYALRLLCDVFDSVLLDVNATVEKYFPDSEVSTFKAMYDLKNEVNAQMSSFLDGMSSNVENIYCELSDKTKNYIERSASTLMKAVEKEPTTEA